ncbi:hypothetical protein [Tahibacter harae]|uniref:DUF1566 domain-containing protein n=1 Tax=Tahibacter harae TaxID=2963937 RepID=A0ABT1QX45_9GAMM|nr:hypothetical protein [Tahibacter harae]MCQ4166859.1 hypothetical protein [Tahibacter harae]
MRSLIAVAVLLVAAIPATAAEPKIAAEPRGMTWGSNPSGADGVVLVSCHGKPASPFGSCEPHNGDTACHVELPLLCLKVDGRPRPPGLAEGSNSPNLAMPGNFYSGWAAGELAATPPLAGTTLTSRLAADALCRRHFGDGWRMAEFHDGLITGSAESGHPSYGGWAYYANGSLPATTRYWVTNNTTRANCWDSVPPPASAPEPEQPVEQHLQLPRKGKS